MTPTPEARERIARDVARWRTRTMFCNCQDATCDSCVEWEKHRSEVLGAFAAVRAALVAEIVAGVRALPKVFSEPDDEGLSAPCIQHDVLHDYLHGLAPETDR